MEWSLAGRNAAQAGAKDAAVARGLAEAQAKEGRPLSDEEIKRIVTAISAGFTVEGDAHIVPKEQP